MAPSVTGTEVDKQPESVSLKLLLKQVYSTHVSKVRDLESEVRRLSQQLEIARMEIQEKSKLECEKCKEMQNAFDACKEYKNALLEQSKRLKELEMKFSSLDTPITKSVTVDPKRNSPAISAEATTVMDSFTDVLKFTEWDDTFAEVDRLDNTQGTSVDDSIPNTPDQKENTMCPQVTQKVPIKTQLQRRKIFSDEKSVNSPSSAGGSASNTDEDVVLVPDTLDVTLAKNSPVKGLSFRRLKKSKAVDISSPDNKENSSSSDSSVKYDKSIHSKKRALSDLSIGETQNKRFSPEQVKEPMVKKDDIIAKICVTRKGSSENEIENKSDVLPGNDCVNKEVVTGKNQSSETSRKVIPMKKVTELLKEAEGWASNFEDFGVDETQAPQSVPLISGNRNLKSDLKIIDDDFLPMSSAITKDEDGWKTSKKKHSQKKSFPKTLKSFSRFKMTLEAPGPNWKKPNYKQTKLSKSSFVIKNLSKKDSNVKSAELYHGLNTDEKSESSTLCGASELASLAFSLDYTQTPSAVNSQASTLEPSTGMLEALSNDANAVCVIEEVSVSKHRDRSGETESFPKTKHPSIPNVETEDEDFHTYPSIDETIAEEIDDGCRDIDRKADNKVDNSFDRLPVPQEPNYKYKEDCVRGKVKRKQLLGFECKECEKYYSDMGLSEEEKKERMQHCSRHRAKFAPPPTPEHFWELDFPNTEECKARGYVAETQKVTLKSRRRRPLAGDNSES